MTKRSIPSSTSQRLSSTHLVSNIRQQRRCSQNTSLSTVPNYSLSDNTGREVARFHRPFKLTCRCCTCYCPCCLQEMEITASGQVVGYMPIVCKITQEKGIVVAFDGDSP